MPKKRKLKVTEPSAAELPAASAEGKVKPPAKAKTKKAGALPAPGNAPVSPPALAKSKSKAIDVEPAKPKEAPKDEKKAKPVPPAKATAAKQKETEAEPRKRYFLRKK